MKEKVIKMYEYLYGISTGNQNFEFKPSEKDNKILDNFVSKLTPSHGDDWLFTFMNYQFSRYIDQETRFGKGKILLGWVIGDKAIQKYKDATDEEKYYGEKFKTDYQVTNILTEPPKVEISKEYLDRERSRFYATERGLIHCTENKLYDPSSKWCMTCHYKLYCKG